MEGSATLPPHVVFFPLPIPFPAPPLANSFSPYFLRFSLKFHDKDNASIEYWQNILRSAVDPTIVVRTVYSGSCIVLVLTPKQPAAFLHSLEKFSETEIARKDLYFGGVRAAQQEDLSLITSLDNGSKLPELEFLPPSRLRSIRLLSPCYEATPTQQPRMLTNAPLHGPSLSPYRIFECQGNTININIIQKEQGNQYEWPPRGRAMLSEELDEYRRSFVSWNVAHRELLLLRRNKFETYLRTRGTLHRHKERASDWELEWPVVEELYAEKYPTRPWVCPE